MRERDKEEKKLNIFFSLDNNISEYNAKHIFKAMKPAKILAKEPLTITFSSVKLSVASDLINLRRLRESLQDSKKIIHIFEILQVTIVITKMIHT